MKEQENRCVVLNRGKGTVTMTFEAYTRVHHDSVMLSILLNNKVGADEDLLKDYRDLPELGTGFAYCQCPVTDNEALRIVYEGVVDDA